MNTNPKKHYIGIDVSKKHLDVSYGTRRFRVTSNPKEIIKLPDQIGSIAAESAHVILEPTGGCELPLLVALSEAEIAWSRPNPRRVSEFARARGMFTKTDKIDAVILEEFGQFFKPVAEKMPEHSIIRLQ